MFMKLRYLGTLVTYVGIDIKVCIYMFTLVYKNTGQMTSEYLINFIIF